MSRQHIRNPGLDIIRTIAVLCVIGVHFFLFTGFYSEPVEGCTMLIMVTLRNSFMICVPLFLMLTGYLSTEKKAGIQYYAKLLHLLSVYVIASFFCALYKMYVQKTGLSILGAIANMFEM